MYVSFFKYFFLIIGSPVFSLLSEKTNSIIENKSYHFDLSQLMKDIIRSIGVTLRNLLWQSVYLISLLILSFIPVLGWIVPIVASFLDCYYVGFSMLDYNSARNNIKPSESMDIINHHKGMAIGNGMIFYMAHLIPFIGWVLAPGYAVISATISLHQARKKSIINI
jgi:CysZ protein